MGLLPQVQYLVDSDLLYEFRDMGDENHCAFAGIKRLCDNGQISYIFFEKHFSKNARTVRSRSSRGMTCFAVAMVIPLVMCTFPDSGLSSPVISPKIVLFPAPF